MGASAWHVRQPWRGDLVATLVAAQEQVLASGEYVWPWDDADPDDDDVVARPTTLDALTAAKQVEEFWEEGTHTVLDVSRVSTDPDDVFAAIRPLTASEVTAVTGSPTPGVDALVALLDDHGPVERLQALDGPQWSGRALPVGDGEEPVEVLFWGWSGD